MANARSILSRIAMAGRAIGDVPEDIRERAVPLISCLAPF